MVEESRGDATSVMKELKCLWDGGMRRVLLEKSALIVEVVPNTVSSVEIVLSSTNVNCLPIKNPAM